MPVFDTPITTDDRGLKKVLGQKLPALLVLFDGTKNDKPLDNALQRAAKKNAGELLIVKVDANENPNTLAKYNNLQAPALVSMTKAFFGRKTIAQAENIRPADVRAHIDHLLLDKPLPEEKAATNGSSNGKKGKKPLAVFDNTFRKEVLKSKTPVLVDFWAPWCGPCRNIAPYIDQMAKEYAGRVKVVKVNTDANPVTSQRFQVQSLPTFMVFEGGQPVGRISGASPPAIQGLIKQVL